MKSTTTFLKSILNRVPPLRRLYHLVRANILFWRYSIFGSRPSLIHKNANHPSMKNWCVMFLAPNRVALVGRKRPKPAHDQVLIRTNCSLISSGTELACLRGVFPVQSHWGKWVCYPWHPGYQNIGSIVDVGSEVIGLKPGQRVATRSSHSQFVTAPARECILVPEQISSEEAAWFALSAVAQIALTRSKLAQVTRAAVIGLGPLGQLMVQWLRAAGVQNVLPIGRSSWRVQLAGARPSDQTTRVQLTIDATGNAEALATAFRITEDFGFIILIGDPPDPTRQRLTSDLLTRGLTLIGCYAAHASFDDSPTGITGLTYPRLAADFFQHVLQKKLDVHSLITHRFSPESASLAYELAAKRRPGTLGILFDWERWASG